MNDDEIRTKLLFHIISCVDHIWDDLLSTALVTPSALCALWSVDHTHTHRERAVLLGGHELQYTKRIDDI